MLQMLAGTRFETADSETDKTRFRLIEQGERYKDQAKGQSKQDLRVLQNNLRD